MSKTPFMPLWVADFVGDTLDLDAKEIGAYMLILMTMWGRDGYLPNDEKKLQRVARCGRDWPRIWGAIQHYFTVEGDLITQARLLKECKNVASKREVNAQNGARGGTAKALKTKKPHVANATVSLKQPEPEPYITTTLLGAGEPFPLPEQSPKPPVQSHIDTVEARMPDMLKAAGITNETRSPGMLAYSEPVRWLEAGCEMDGDIIPTLRSIAARGKLATSWAYFSNAVFEAKAKREQPPPVVVLGSQRAATPRANTAQRLTEIAERMAVHG